MIRLGVAGAMGRMGRAVLEHAAGDAGFETVAALTAPDDPQLGSTIRVADRALVVADRMEGTCDVLVEFSTPSGTMAWLEVCERRRIPMVIGTTGHDAAQQARIREAGHVVPVFHSANVSIGVGAILGFLGSLARTLGDQYDVEIVEAHHGRKVDAPSGTALTLVQEISTALGRDGEPDVAFGRQGQVGPRPKGQIGVHAVRMGDLVSEHDIHFSGPGETVTIRHAAHSRATYAAGALRAAAWLVAAGPGYYTIRDLIGRL